MKLTKGRLHNEGKTLRYADMLIIGTRRDS